MQNLIPPSLKFIISLFRTRDGVGRFSLPPLLSYHPVSICTTIHRISSLFCCPSRTIAQFHSNAARVIIPVFHCTSCPRFLLFWFTITRFHCNNGGVFTPYVLPTTQSHCELFILALLDTCTSCERRRRSAFGSELIQVSGGGSGMCWMTPTKVRVSLVLRRFSHACSSALELGTKGPATIIYSSYRWNGNNLMNSRC